MLTHISIGPATIPSYPFLALIGLWAGMWLAAREAEHAGIDGDHIYNIGLYGLLGGLLGGRLWYVLAHREAYAGAPGQAFALTANAIAIPEAIILALVVAIVYSRKHALSLPAIADAIAPGAALALVIGGIGAFLGSQTLGTLAAPPWGIVQFGQLRHPAHLYQTLATAIIFAIIWKIRLNPRRPGFSFLLFAELYAASRLLLDPFFDLPATIGDGFRVVQVSALAAMVIILAMMAWLDGTNRAAGQRRRE